MDDRHDRVDLDVFSLRHSRILFPLPFPQRVGASRAGSLYSLGVD
jgi:hypothetical protein